MKTRDFRLVQLSALIVAAAISLWTAGAWAFEVDPSSPVAEGLKHADAGIAAILAVPDAGATWLAVGFGDPTLLVKKIASSLGSAPEQGTLGKTAAVDSLRETAKTNGAMMVSMRGLLVITAGDRHDSAFSKLSSLPNKGATPAFATFVSQGPEGDAKAGVATGTLRIPRGLIEDAVRLLMTSR